MPSSQDQFRRRFSLRGSLSAFAALSSLLLLATCDLDKITAAKKDGGTGTTLNFSIGGGSTVTLGGTTPLSITPAFPGTISRWVSSAPAVAKVDSLTGVVTGLSIGTASITARLLAMELDTGFVKSQDVRVRYNGIRISTIDSITGLGLTKAVNVFGTNKQNVVQATSLTSGSTLAIHDSGATTQTIASLTGTNIKGLKNGTAYIKAIYDTDLADSVKVKVRQVAKTILFPDTAFIVTAMNYNKQLVATARDVADSAMATPRLRFSSLDTNKIAIDSITGIARMKIRDSTRVFVRSDTVTKSVRVWLRQLASTVAKAAGDSQTAQIYGDVAIAPSVVVKDSGGAVVPGASVLFEVVTGGGTLTGATQVADANGTATVTSWKLGPTAGTQTLRATSGAGAFVFTATATAGPPTRVAFTTQPNSQTTNTSLDTVRVAIVDSVGNVATSATDAITLSLGANPGSATLSGTVTQNAVNGVAKFGDLKLNAVGTGYTLVATSGSLTSGASNPFNVFGPAAKLAFTVQPSNVVVDRTIAPNVVVDIQDGSGNRVTTATDSVTVSIGTNPGAATLAGTLKVASVNGRATFSTLSLNAAGNGYTLNAAATGLTAASSTGFNVLAVGAAARVLVITEPTNAVATQTINASTSPAGIRVAVVDSGGATVTTSTQTIALSILVNPGGSTASLSGTTSKAAVNGIATFTDLGINRSATGYKLLASATGTSLGTDTTAAFNITTGTASKLGFVVQPTNINVSQTMSPAVQVAVQDAGGNTVTGTSHQITLAPSSGALGGTAVQPVSNGVATFSNLTMTMAASNYTLTATSSPVLTSATSSTFNVVAAGGATRLHFLTEPSNAVAATAIAPAIQVEVTDGTGTRVTSGTYSVTLAIANNAGGSSLSGSVTTSTVSGVATFSNVSLNKSGTGYTLSATATGLTSTTSAAFNITSGTATRVAFVGQPANTVAGNAIGGPVSVAITDDNGNTVVSSTATVEMQMGNQNPCCTPLNGTVLVAAVNGIATFSNLKINAAGTYSLNARIQGSTTFSTSSSSFVVSAGSAYKLGFAENLPTVGAGSTLTGVKVQVQDSLGNLVSSGTQQVTVAMASGPAGATIQGTTAVAAVGGVATFADLVLTKASDRSNVSYQLSASTAGLNAALSNNFTVTAGTPAKLAWTTSAPDGAIRNAPLRSGGGQLGVSLADQYGNLASSSTLYSVTIAIGTNPGAATLGGTVTRSTNTFGSVSFDDLTLSAAAAGYTLTASASGLTGATTGTFDVAAFGTATNVAFKVQPSNANAGATIAPAVQVAITDSYGNTVTTGTASTATVSVNIAANPSSANFVNGSVTSVAAVSGVADFSTLAIDKPGNSFTLQSCASSINCVTSSPFNVTSGTSMTTTTSAPRDIVVTGSTLLWAQSNGIQTMSTSGSSSTQLVAAAKTVLTLATDGTNVYYLEAINTNGDSAVLKKYPLAGGAATTIVSAIDSVAPYIEVDGTNVYFQSGTGVKAIAKASGTVTEAGATPLYTANLALQNTRPFTQNGGSLYFVNGSGIQKGTTGGAAATNISGWQATSLFVSGSTVFFVTTGNQVRSVTTSGASDTWWNNIPANDGKLVSDGTSVWWADDPNGVRRMSTAGGSLITLYSSAVWGLALDATNVYWAHSISSPSAGTEILKMSK